MSDNKSTSLARQLVAGLGALAALFGLLTAVNEATAGGVAGWLEGWWKPTSAVIVSPADVTVPHEVQLFGTIEHLDDRMVWAVSLDPTTNTLYPQDRPCRVDDGRFNCGTYYVGSDSGHGEKITILIVAADAKAGNVFASYQTSKGGPKGSNPGLPELPAGAEKITEATVVRN